VTSLHLPRPMVESRVASRGGTLEVLRWSADRGRTAVAVHGFLDHAWSWDGLVPRLRTVDLVSYSARGHGRSDRADAYQWADFVVDLAMVVRSAATGPVDLIGHSWGAHIALELAHAEPELVRRVVNIDGMIPDHPERVRPDVLDRVRRRADRPFPHDRTGFGTVGEAIARRCELTPRVPPEIAASFARNGIVKVGGRWQWSLDPLLVAGMLPWDARHGLPLDVRKAVDRIDQPVLLITGGQNEAQHLTPDRSLAWELAERPHVRHAHVLDAGHYVHLEHPELVATFIEEFLH
jgi:pimeloyl-ACP methyl ester carboxylesterase